MTAHPPGAALPRRIVYTHGGGRLGNQLIAYSHLLAFWKEQDSAFGLVNTAMWQFETLFAEDVTVAPTTAPPPLVLLARRLFRAIESLPLSAKMRNRLYLLGAAAAHLLAWLLPGHDALSVRDLKGATRRIGRQRDAIDLGNAIATQTAFGTARSLLLAGYGLRSWPLVRRHREFLRRYLRPADHITAHAAQRLAILRQDCDVIIGVQIRHGDYRTWRDGRFFFPVEHYAQSMRILAERYASRGRIGFAICSETPHPAASFVEIGRPVLASWDDRSELAGPMTDIAVLSMCDLIMAPPSTFAFWAAFLGNRPLLCLTDRDVTVATVEPVQDSIFDAAADPVMSLAVS